jgi:fibronectin-binding autotransporter adhesin
VGATISSDVAGSVGLTKVGSGTLNLAGANSYTGTTMINAGVLGIASALFSSEPTSPSGNVAINNGSTLRFNVSGIILSANRNVSLGAGGGVIDTAGNNDTIAGAISGTSLTKSGSGTLFLSNSNSYSGGTVINAGALQVSTDANLGAMPASFTAGNITLDGGTLRFGASFDLSNNRGISLIANGGAIDTQGFSNPSGYSPSKGFSGPGNLTKVGTGTFFASATTGGTNDVWKGSLIIKEGTWKIVATDGLPYNPPSADGLQAAQVTLDGGTWQIGANVSATNGRRGITVAAGGGTIDTQAFNLTWQGPLAGNITAANLSKIGSGQLQLNTSGVAASSYAGSFNINGGSVVLNGGGAMGDLAAVNLANTGGVSVSITGATETIGSLSGGGVSGGSVSLNTSLVTGGNNNTTTFSASISSIGGLTKTGTGVFTLARSLGNSYGGGTTIAGGTLLVTNTSGSGTGTGAVSVNAGAVLGGTGIIQGGVTNSGTVAPGVSLGTLHLGGSYTQTAGGLLEIDLASAASHDELAVTSAASLSGMLAVSLLSGFVPQQGNVFEIMTAAGFGGSKFTNTSLPALAGGLVWNINYGTNAVTLSVAVPGDFNGNGAVDAADYVVWRKGLGTTYMQADYDVWRANFGQPQAAAAAGSTLGAVPEPPTLLLLLITTFGLACLRRGPIKARMVDVATFPT